LELRIDELQDLNSSMTLFTNSDLLQFINGSIPDSQFSAEGKTNCPLALVMREKIALSDRLEERLIEFSAHIIRVAGKLSKTLQGRHIAKQLLRSGTAGAANYAEARGAESRADFVHKMRVVQKELNETSVWLRVVVKSGLLSSEFIVGVIAENKELCRIITASIRTARRANPSDEN
jgi:four helix bundle protein